MELEQFQTGALTQDRIAQIEGVLRQFDQIEIPPVHVFAENLYAREITIPKGCILTGRVHRKDDLQIMISGDISVQTPTGWERFQGYHMFRGHAGEKRIGYTHEDTTWVTVHSTEETDLEVLETTMLFPESETFDFATGKLKRSIAIDRTDYLVMLEDIGETHEVAQAETLFDGDRVDVELYGAEVRGSAIHGLGVFATEDFADGDPVGGARFEGKRTQLGRFTNHSASPNAEMRDIAGDIWLIATMPIRIGSEITIDYRSAYDLTRGTK